ncbi:MAG: hypothetical protein C0615_07810 [Desulfuromonas sp.]|nr:MAG: hypothetical protein C0615_07810 [Desulfuromonas sp.]
MAVKDLLRVVLLANNTTVAVSKDPTLWQYVYSSIQDEENNTPSDTENKNKSTNAKPDKLDS